MGYLQLLAFGSSIDIDRVHAGMVLHVYVNIQRYILIHTYLYGDVT